MSSRVKLFATMHGSTMTGLSGSTLSASGPGSRQAFPRTAVDIVLDNHYQAKVYTSGDALTGTVTIAPLRNIPFDLFEIVLLGTTRTIVDHVGAPVTSNQTILKLQMPIDESAYPVPRMLQAGKTYTLPLHFVVPHHLTISACNHTVASAHVHSHHTTLPPSMGTGRSASGGSGGGGGGTTSGTSASWERDDMAPDMAAVEYSIKARIYREDPRNDGSGKSTLSKIVEAVCPIRILPASLVDAPLPISKTDRLYKLQAAKTVRRGLFAQKKMGTVTASAGDASGGTPLPAPIVLRPDAASAAPTKAYVRLLFDPARPDAQPPHITGWSAKLTSYTHYSSSAMATFPNMGDWPQAESLLTERRGSYSTSVPLATRPIRHHKWDAKVDAARRDSGYCSSDSSSDSATASTGLIAPPLGSPPSASSASAAAASLVYTSTLELDIALPTHKRTFLPTFHSCLVSRTYALQLSVTMAPASSTSSSAPSPSASAVTVSVTVPLQIVVGASATQQDSEGLPSFEAAVEEAEADAHLQPRVRAVPDTCYQETSTPPGYSG